MDATFACRLKRLVCVLYYWWMVEGRTKQRCRRPKGTRVTELPDLSFSTQVVATLSSVSRATSFTFITRSGIV